MNETEARARAHQLAAVRVLLDEVYPDAGSTDTVTLVARLISERAEARAALTELRGVANDAAEVGRAMGIRFGPLLHVLRRDES